jgi:hypothetical protein
VATRGLRRYVTSLGRERREVWNRVVVMALVEEGLRLLDAPSNRPHPEAGCAAALATKERAHVRQDGVGHIEDELEGSKTEHAHGKAPGEPFGLVKRPEHLGDRFPSELHRAIGHQEMDGRVGVPDIELRIERSQRLGIVANRPFDEAGLARRTAGSSLDPAGDAATDAALAVEQQDRLGVYDSNGCVTAVRRLWKSG